MPKFRCPQVGFFTRSKGSVLGFSMLAWLTASSLAWGQLQPITFTPIDASATAGATTISSNQKVVVNQYGIFVAYLKARTVQMEQTQWILKRSVDGGASFTIIDASPALGAPGAHSTYAPLLETDSFGSVYMIRGGNANGIGDAYLRKYSPLDNFAPPTTPEGVLPNGGGQKAAMLIDELRGQIYYIAETFRGAPTAPDTTMKTALWFYVIGLDGTLRDDFRLTYSPNPDLDASYPHLALDEQGDLYVAWTNVKGRVSAEFSHFSSHVMRSRDGGSTWQKLSGASVTLPVVGDPGSDPNNIPPEITMINEANELGASKSLWTMRVKEGKIHLVYRSNTDPPQQRYVRIDTVTGVKDIPNTTSFAGAWNGDTVHLNSLDGFCTAANALDHTVYCVANRALDNDPTKPSNRLAVLVSYDNGQTWQLFATTGDLGKVPYGITGAREIRDGHIVGMVTLTPILNDPAPNAAQNVVQFFKIPVTTQVTQRLHAVGVTTNASAAGYPAANAIDGNSQTLWTASLSLDPQNNNNASITLDLGTSKQIDRVRWMSGIGTPFPSYCPANYTISVSQDNVNWTTVVTRTGNTSGIINGNEPMGVNGRYIRFATTQVNDGNGWALSFYEFWVEGTALPATRLPATTGGVQTPGYETNKANDGRYDTQFVASLTPASQNNVGVLDLYFSATHRQVARVKWVASVGLPYPAAPPRDFVIQVSDDGGNWTTVASRWAPNWTGSTWEGSIPVGLSTRHLRILTSAVFDETGWSLGLLEFWAEGW